MAPRTSCRDDDALWHHELSAGAGDPSAVPPDRSDRSGRRPRADRVPLEDNTFAASRPGDVPTGFTDSNANLDMWNSFYWNKQAMALHPGDITKAVNYNWMLAADCAYGHGMSRPIPHSIKTRGEPHLVSLSRTSGHDHSRGGRARPSLIGRVLDGGATQVTEFTYNAKGKVTSITDPAGRQTTSTYATNGLDLLEVRQVVSGGTDVLAAYSTTRPASAGDDQTRLARHDAYVQLLRAAPDDHEREERDDDARVRSGTQNLLTVTGPVSGATTTFTYDAYGRVETVTAADGYTVRFDYDALNRVTQRTYPDDTTETFTYTRLDLVEKKDRLGRITRNFYDGYGRRMATRDPAGRTISLCLVRLRTLDALVDAKGQRTDVGARHQRPRHARDPRRRHDRHDLHLRSRPGA